MMIYLFVLSFGYISCFIIVGIFIWLTWSYCLGHLFTKRHRLVGIRNPITNHCNDVIMGVIASKITSLTIVYLTVYSGADQRKYQSSVSLAFVRGIHRRPVNSPHKMASSAENVSIWWRHHDLRRSYDHLRFKMGIPIPIRWCLFSEYTAGHR